jgi:hypothetical protein
LSENIWYLFNSRRIAINLGIGHRLLVEDDMAIVGVNFFTDYETKSSHKRLSLGLEYQRANFSANINVGNRKVGEFLFVAQWQFYREFAITCSANINKYHMFSDKKLVNSVKERGMSAHQYSPHYDPHQMHLKMYWLCY